MSRDEREKRLAEALRSNLRRRKAQARAMPVEDGAPPAAPAPTDGRDADGERQAGSNAASPEAAPASPEKSP